MRKLIMALVALLCLGGCLGSVQPGPVDTSGRLGTVQRVPAETEGCVGPSATPADWTRVPLCCRKH